MLLLSGLSICFLVCRTASGFQIGDRGLRTSRRTPVLAVVTPSLAVVRPSTTGPTTTPRRRISCNDVKARRQQQQQHSSRLYQSPSDNITPTAAATSSEGGTTPAAAAATAVMKQQPPATAVALPPVALCPDCDLCDGSGRIAGGIGAVFAWIPIKAYRPCPNFVAKQGNVYIRAGQALDEIAFGRDPDFQQKNNNRRQN